MLRICSRIDLQRLIDTSDVSIVVISINDSTESPLDILKSEIVSDKLILHFDDIETCGCFKGEILFTEEQAKRILKFAERHKDFLFSNTEIFAVQCHGGVCRSAAVAAGILKFLKVDDFNIFMSGQYLPNRFVYETMLTAANIQTSTQALNAKFAESAFIYDIKHPINDFD